MTETTHSLSPIANRTIQVLSADGQPAPMPIWLESEGSWTNAADPSIVLVILGSCSEVPTSLITKASKSATVVVLGPRDGHAWRGEALAAGAFGCLSSATPDEDSVGLVVAAVRYSMARSEANALRQYFDRLCSELVQSFAEAMEKLAGARDEAGRTRRVLEDIQLRVLRSMV